MHYLSFTFTNGHFEVRTSHIHVAKTILHLIFTYQTLLNYLHMIDDITNHLLLVSDSNAVEYWSSTTIEVLLIPILGSEHILFDYILLCI